MGVEGVGLGFNSLNVFDASSTVGSSAGGVNFWFEEEQHCAYDCCSFKPKDIIF
jgi:hypothetical protein